MLRGCYVTEQHRTQTEFEDTLVMKSFLFQFVNNFAAISYIAYFKGRYQAYAMYYTETLPLKIKRHKILKFKKLVRSPRVEYGN